jgi:hypothetical protein
MLPFAVAFRTQFSYLQCDGDSPCQGCRDQNAECRYDRAQKRRGPVNRAAESYKRQKIDGGDLGRIDLPSKLLDISLALTHQYAGEVDAAKKLYFSYLHDLLPVVSADEYRVEAAPKLSEDPTSDYFVVQALIVGISAWSYQTGMKISTTYPDPALVPESRLRIDEMLRLVDALIDSSSSVNAISFDGLLRRGITLRDVQIQYLASRFFTLQGRLDKAFLHLCQASSFLTFAAFAPKSRAAAQNLDPAQVEIAGYLHAGIYVQAKHLEQMHSIWQSGYVQIPDETGNEFIDELVRVYSTYSGAKTEEDLVQSLEACQDFKLPSRYLDPVASDFAPGAVQPQDEALLLLDEQKLILQTTLFSTHHYILVQLRDIISSAALDRGILLLAKNVLRFLDGLSNTSAVEPIHRDFVSDLCKHVFLSSDRT